MATPQAPAKKVDPAVTEKLSQGYRYVTIPSKDIYDFPFEGIWINANQYKPGTHLVNSQVADTLEERLKVFERASIRLMRPSINKEAVEAVNRRSADQVGGPSPEIGIG